MDQIMTDTPSSFVEQLLPALKARAEEAGVFGDIAVVSGRLECAADGSAEPATYRVEFVGGKPWVSLVMEDRWQSESIESELMHTGDSLEELLEEELADLGYEGEALRFEHYRSDDMLFTFRSPLPLTPDQLGMPGAVETAALCLLGYEACFRGLGDMSEGEDD